jgi:hypothetical protein
MKKGHSIEKPLLRLAPQLIHFAAMYFWAANSKFDVLHNQTHMFLTLHGMIFSYQCVRFEHMLPSPEHRD